MVNIKWHPAEPKALKPPAPHALPDALPDEFALQFAD